MNDLVGGSNDDEISLPKATVSKLLNEYLPESINCTKETRDLISDCCTGNDYLNENIHLLMGLEFVHLIASESNDVCEKNNKKTIMVLN